MLNVSKVIAVSQESCSLKPRARTAFDNVVVERKSKGPECRCVICTFSLHKTSVAFDVTQSEGDTYVHL